MTIEAQLERIAIALETLAYHVSSGAATPAPSDPPEAPTTRTRTRKAKDATAGGAAAEPPAPTATAGGAAAEPPAPTAPVVDLVMLRSRCGKLASAGHRAAVIALIEQHGYKLLTDAPPSLYPALWAGLDRIEAGGQP
jgi:hypothetical protein